MQTRNGRLKLALIIKKNILMDLNLDLLNWIIKWIYAQLWTITDRRGRKTNGGKFLYLRSFLSSGCF